MQVMNARHHELARKVDHGGVLADECPDVGIRTYFDKLAVRDGDGFGPGALFIDRVDPAVGVGGVGGLGGRQRFRCE